MDVLTLSLFDLLEVLVSVVATGLFTLGGLVAEHAGFLNVLGGQATLGAWEIWMGGVALFAGVYLLGYQHLLPRLSTDAA